MPGRLGLVPALSRLVSWDPRYADRAVEELFRHEQSARKGVRRGSLPRRSRTSINIRGEAGWCVEEKGSDGEKCETKVVELNEGPMQG